MRKQMGIESDVTDSKARDLAADPSIEGIIRALRQTLSILMSPSPAALSPAPQSLVSWLDHQRHRRLQLRSPSSTCVERGRHKVLVHPWANPQTATVDMARLAESSELTNRNGNGYESFDD